jgi:hypothetical protein
MGVESGQVTKFFNGTITWGLGGVAHLDLTDSHTGKKVVQGCGVLTTLSNQGSGLRTRSSEVYGTHLSPPVYSVDDAIIIPSAEWDFQEAVKREQYGY